MAGEPTQGNVHEVAQQADPDARVVYVDINPVEILRFFDGFELVEPGLVYPPLWRPDQPGAGPADPSQVWGLAGVARKP